MATAPVRLGTSAAFCGCLGSDSDGDGLLAVLEERGVDTKLVRRSSEAPTRRVMVARSKDGDRSFAGFADGLPADAFADCLLDAKTLRPSAARRAGSKAAAEPAPEASKVKEAAKAGRPGRPGRPVIKADGASGREGEAGGEAGGEAEPVAGGLVEALAVLKQRHNLNSGIRSVT